MRKFVILSTLIFIITINSVASQLRGKPKIDSLLIELQKSKEDTNKVNLLISISYDYSKFNVDEGLKFGQQSLDLSQKLKWKKGEARAFNILGIIARTKDDSKMAMEYYQKALEINESIDNKQGVARNLGNIGQICIDKSDFPKAVEYLEKALKIERELDNKSGIAGNITNIGSIYFQQSNYSEALKCFLDALKNYEEIGNKHGTASNLLNIGNIYVLQKQYHKALDYYLKSLKICKELNLNDGIANNLANIGMIYYEQNDIQKALDYYLEALKINYQMGSKSGIANNLINIGNLYIKIGDVNKSMNYLNRGLVVNEEISDTRQIIYNLYAISDNYLKQAEQLDSLRILGNKNIKFSENKLNLHYEAALKYSLRAAEMADSIGLGELQHPIYQNVAKSYEGLKRYAEALKYYKKYQDSWKSVFSNEKNKAISEITESFERDKKIEQYKIREKRREEKEMMRTYLFLAGFLLLSIIFIFSFIRFRENKKMNAKLTTKNHEIELQKFLVEEKNEQIYASLRYASTIQHAIMPWKSTLKEAFRDYFLIFMPKDIVSGDCFWYEKVGDIQFLAVIDCTGHGIPGSMLTVIASSVLDDAVLSKKLTDTGEILTYINTKVTEVLNQKQIDNNIRDGMELILIAIYKDHIQYSGAGRPLIVKNGTLQTFKTDRRSIAGNTDSIDFHYSSNEIAKSEDMIIYLTTDGFADQMNVRSKKYGSKRFITLLETLSDKPFTEQQQLLEKELSEHKGFNNQIDDITIIGVKV